MGWGRQTTGCSPRAWGSEDGENFWEVLL